MFVHGGFEVELFRFFHQGQHHIDLATLGNFSPHQVVGVGAVFIGKQGGLDGFASGGQFVDLADVQIAVQGQR